MYSLLLVALGLSFLAALLIYLVTQAAATCPPLPALDETWLWLQTPKILSATAAFLSWWAAIGLGAGLLGWAASLPLSFALIVGLGRWWPQALWPSGFVALGAICAGCCS